MTREFWISTVYLADSLHHVYICKASLTCYNCCYCIHPITPYLRLLLWMCTVIFFHQESKRATQADQFDYLLTSCLALIEWSCLFCNSKPSCISYILDYNPVSQPESDATQMLLLLKHPPSAHLMQEAHVQSSHRGLDATLAWFRVKYWTPQGAKFAVSVVRTCQTCRRKDPKPQAQLIGSLPSERHKPLFPFSYVTLDLFGSYRLRGEVQKQTTGSGYCVIFTDLISRAVHIEACFAFDTPSFRRFTSLQGWPNKIYLELKKTDN